MVLKAFHTLKKVITQIWPSRGSSLPTASVSALHRADKKTIGQLHRQNHRTKVWLARLGLDLQRNPLAIKTYSLYLRFTSSASRVFVASVLGAVLHAQELEYLKAIEGESRVGHHSCQCWHKAAVQGTNSTLLQMKENCLFITISPLFHLFLTFLNILRAVL